MEIAHRVRRPGTAIVRNIPPLPVETLATIFTYCETRDLISRALVCRQWAHVALAVAWKDLELSYIIGERQTASLKRLINIRQSVEASLAGKSSFGYFAYVRNVSIVLRLVGGSKHEQQCADTRVHHIRTILSNLSHIADLKLVLDVNTPFHARGTAFIEHLLTLPTPTHSTHLVISNVPCNNALLNSIAQKYGFTLHSFHFVNGEPVSVQSAMRLCRLAPMLESLALIVPYEGLLMKTITARNPKLKMLGLHFRNPGAPAHAVPVPPMALTAAFNPIGNTVGFVGVPGVNSADVIMIDDDDDEDDEIPAEIPKFLTSFKGLFAAGIRLTCIKISGQHTIPEGDGSRILEILGREAIGLKRLQFTAVRDIGLGEDVTNVSALSSLEHLIVSLTSISSNFLIRIAQTCPHLTELRAEGTQISDECVRAFATNCKNLKNLQLALCVRLTIHAIVALIQRGSGRLQHIDISYCWPILRYPAPLLILLWLIEDNPELEKFGVMFRPFHDFTSPTLQKLAGRFEVGEEKREIVEEGGERIFEHVVVGSKWLDAVGIRRSWMEFQKGGKGGGWLERIWRVVRGAHEESLDERALSWLNGLEARPGPATRNGLSVRE